ncbi:TetR/AcrR family transcriptional regulator [Gordonibacter massiliensis (ex Traore et al. 2017)]|uniref:TetR/AcrR family transcriptional regulator n=1 Tax=Gordonibacter massiliensis (ex Traore et al. 2017) TaxID=1841863 RepID=A0A842J920_9ACTN|nr:TetR/AcrR family transcriptional regulator [Gordonibacter massiliensis (ex Traore et al. 2017)]MBC2888303.1 TetR/AcrR family transcriptional regulator [Gordonibacter massiliensis (ex Traore et al. 2017)]
MARPKYREGELTARERLEDAFWELLAQHPVGEITVGMLCARAGCNRGTFYYHFEGIEDMAARVAAESLPNQIPALVRGYLADGAVSVDFDEAAKRDVERLALLVGRHSSPELARTVKAALVKSRLDDLGIEWESLGAQGRVIVSFMADGLLGALAQHVEEGGEGPGLDAMFAAVFDTFSKPALDYLRKCLPEQG